jgi:hypothetical protein
VTYKTQYFVTVVAPPEANATPSGFYDVANLMVSTAPSYLSGGNLFEFFNWIGTAALTPSFNVLVNQPMAFQAQYVRDISSNISFTRSGLTFNRSNQIFYGTITITNNGNEFYSNALPLALTGLPAGVMLVNQGGVFKGNPWLPTPGASGLAPGASLTVPVQFKIPAGVNLNYGVTLYSFH